jgi:hypothetical protein
LGCALAHGMLWGVTAVSAGLYEDGYTDIVNIDISDVIIQQMVEEQGDRYPLMTCTRRWPPHPRPPILGSDTNPCPARTRYRYGDGRLADGL